VLEGSVGDNGFPGRGIDKCSKDAIVDYDLQIVMKRKVDILYKQ
jgi:hypothetical protein